MANNAIQIVVFGVLAVVIAMAIVIFFPVDCTVSNKVEGFAVQPGPKVCPSGTKMYIDGDGNTNCCQGEVMGSQCEGTIDCTFSSDGSKGIRFCGEGRVKRYDGEIWPMVKQLFNQNANYSNTFTNTVFPFFLNFIQIIQRNVPQTISKTTYDNLIKLQTEEIRWKDGIQTMSPKDLNNRVIFEEETMRIITKSLELLQNEPIAKDPMKLAAKIQQETCKK
jgi:hypothetical protein